MKEKQKTKVKEMEKEKYIRALIIFPFANFEIGRIARTN
jgi:hypothetical protein